MERIWVLMLVALLGCRFDGGGFASDDTSGGDDVAPIDAGDNPDDPDAAPAPDAMVAPPAGLLVARPTLGMVLLDGLDTEYVAAGTEFESYEIQNGALYESLDGYQASARVRFAALHDDTSIYLFAGITDATYRIDSASVWNDDGVVIYLDAAGDAGGEFGVDDHAIAVRGDGQWQDYGPVGTSATVTVARVTTAGGYNLEIRITKASLQTGALGDAIGFDLALTDDDGWVDSDYDGYSMWFRSNRPVCTDCCNNPPDPYCDTSLYGQLVME